MRCRVARARGKGGIGATNAAGDVAGGAPIVNTDGVDGQVQHTEVASLDVDKQRARRVKRPQ